MYQDKTYRTKSKLQGYTDNTKKYEIEDILQLTTKQWEEAQSTNAGAGTHWAKFDIQNRSKDSTWVLHYPGASQMNVFLIKDNRVIQHLKGETVMPIQERDTLSPSVKNDLFLVPNERYTVVVNINYRKPPTWSSMHISPVHIFKFHTSEKPNSFFMTQGLFQGMIWIILIYNILVFVQVRDKSYLHYGHYLFWVAIYFAQRQGLVDEFIVIDEPFFYDTVWIGSTGGVSIAYFLFTRSFFEMHQNLPKLGRYIGYWTRIKFGLIILTLVMAAFKKFSCVIMFGTAISGLEILGSFYIIYQVYTRLRQIAVYFLIGNLCLLGVTLFYAVSLILYWHGIAGRK